MRLFTTVSLVMAGLAVFAVSKSQQSAERADEVRNALRVSTERPASANDSRILGKNIVALTTANEDLIAARKQARSTLTRFQQLYSQGRTGVYSVKMPLTQNGKTEHIWVQVDAINGDTFEGRLANQPVNGDEYNMGDRITVERKQVEDWMIRTEEGIRGAYTSRVAIKALAPDQAAKMQKMFID